MIRILLCLLIGALWTIPVSPTIAQRIDDPFSELELPQLRELGLFMDGMQSSSRSVSVSISNGTKTIDAVENDIRTHIEEDTELGTISMTVTKTYGPDQIDELMHTQPELYMHLKAIPKEVGDASFEISVGVTKKYEADNADDLQERFPEAFDVYEKYSKNEMIQQQRSFPRMLTPRLIRPVDPGARIDIDPDQVRVHEDDDDPEQSDPDKGGETHRKNKPKTNESDDGNDG